MSPINIKHRVTGSHITIINLPNFSLSISAHCIYTSRVLHKVMLLLLLACCGYVVSTWIPVLFLSRH